MPMLRGRCLPCDFERAFTNLTAGIRVVTVSPGFIETDAATRMIQRMADKDKSDYTTAWQKLILRGRLGGPGIQENSWRWASTVIRDVPRKRLRIAFNQDGALQDA